MSPSNPVGICRSMSASSSIFPRSRSRTRSPASIENTGTRRCRSFLGLSRAFGTALRTNVLPAAHRDVIRTAAERHVSAHDCRSKPYCEPLPHRAAPDRSRDVASLGHRCVGSKLLQRRGSQAFEFLAVAQVDRHSLALSRVVHRKADRRLISSRDHDLASVDEPELLASAKRRQRSP